MLQLSHFSLESLQIWTQRTSHQMKQVVIQKSHNKIVGFSKLSHNKVVYHFVGLIVILPIIGHTKYATGINHSYKDNKIISLTSDIYWSSWSGSNICVAIGFPKFSMAHDSKISMRFRSASILVLYSAVDGHAFFSVAFYTPQKPPVKTGSSFWSGFNWFEKTTGAG